MSFGSIFYRSDDRYQGNVQINGIYKSFYGHSKKEVQEKIDNFVYDAKYKNVNSENLILLSTYSLNYLNNYKKGVVKDSTFDRYESTVNCYIKNSVIDIPLYNLEDGIIQNYLGSLTSLLSYSSLKKIYDILCMVLFYAYRKKHINYDIASFLVVPKSKKETKVIEVYSNNEIKSLIDTIEKGIISLDYNYKRRYRIAPGYLVLYFSGLRVGELLALEKSDIDFDNKIIHVNKTLSHVKARDSNIATAYNDVVTIPKTNNSIRDVPISDNVRKYLLWLMSDDIDSLYLIHNLFGERMRLRSFQQTFKRICIEDSHVQYKGLHALRHTFANDLIQKGVDISIVSKLLGHSSVKFTYDRYIHPDREVSFNAVNLL